MTKLTPMEAAIALFEEDDATSTALVDSLSRVVFDTPQPAAASGVKRVLARLALRYLTRTTSVVDGIHRNPSLERTKYDYALIMLHSTDEESANLVEGGDPMNAPYMMGLPEIRENATIWDRLFLDSVISLDVRLRFRWETTATYELAKAKLDTGSPVRLKAGAAGTGLSMVLAYHRLIKDGYEPERITVHITDRAPENCAKTNKLLAHLGYGGNITAYPEDLLEAPEPEQPYDVLTLVGILEYFIGTTATTTEELQGKPAPTTGPQASALFQSAAKTLAPGGTLIINTFHKETGARLLEPFGKQFRYRTKTELTTLAKAANLSPIKSQGSSHVYNVELFEKID